MLLICYIKIRLCFVQNATTFRIAIICLKAHFLVFTSFPYNPSGTINSAILIRSKKIIIRSGLRKYYFAKTRYAYFLFVVFHHLGKHFWCFNLLTIQILYSLFIFFLLNWHSVDSYFYKLLP